MRISDWSSDVCSSDLGLVERAAMATLVGGAERSGEQHTERAREHRRLVRQHVAEQIVGDDHVELLRRADEIGRASCRERGCQYGSILVVCVSLKKKYNNRQNTNPTAKRNKNKQ